MKAIKSIRLITSVIAITIFIVALKSCKKANIDMQPNITIEDARAASIKAIKAKYGDVAASYTVNVNKTADQVFYRNAAGKMVSLYGNSNFNPQNTNNLCAYTCNNTMNPANLHIVYTLDYVQRFYLEENCSPSEKSTVNVKWTVSVPFGITNVTPDGVLNTFGEIKFTPSSGSPVVLTATANDIFSVTSLGTDPACGVNTLYAVTYSITQVDNSNFASGTQLDALLSLSNDCALIGYLSATSYVSAPSFNQNAYLPCNRIEKVWIQPYLGPSSCATATGNYNVCTYPSGLSPIDYHEVEYRLVTSGSSLKWDDQTGSVFWGVPVGAGSYDEKLDPYTGVSNLLNITPSSGTWLVRYRNVKTSVCNLIYSAGSNPSPGPANANGAWGNTALWIVEVLTP